MRIPALLIAPLALAAAACGAGRSPSTAAGSPGSSSSVSTRAVGSLGTVLVDAQGRTLYLFMPEKGGKIKCTGSCASLWPPLRAGSAAPSASGGAHPSMLSTVTSPSGTGIVTYAGWPLHTYASDGGPGSTSGQGVAGQWYVISPGGRAVTRKATASSAGGGGGGYGGGY